MRLEYSQLWHRKATSVYTTHGAIMSTVKQKHVFTWTILKWMCRSSPHCRVFHGVGDRYDAAVILKAAGDFV
jgi:hypothetical protein